MASLRNKPFDLLQCYIGCLICGFCQFPPGAEPDQHMKVMGCIPGTGAQVRFLSSPCLMRPTAAPPLQGRSWSLELLVFVFYMNFQEFYKLNSVQSERNKVESGFFLMFTNSSFSKSFYYESNEITFLKLLTKAFVWPFFRLISFLMLLLLLMTITLPRFLLAFLLSPHMQWQKSMFPSWVISCGQLILFI